MATIRDIADRLGISPSAVSKGLNGASDISDTLRASILETAVELGYTRKKTKKKDLRKLAVFMDEMEYYLEDDFGYDLIRGFKSAAFKEGWQVEVIPISHAFQKKRSYDTFMLASGFSGAFLCGTDLSDPWMADLQATNVPTVLLDNYIRDNPMVGSVGTDSNEGIGLAIAYLVSLGHRRIAFLDGSQVSMIAEYRMTAYKHHMRLHHLDIPDGMAIYNGFRDQIQPAHVDAFLRHGATAILCGSDTIAFGVMEECRKHGLSVPEDISIVGYDDLPSSAAADPPLTTVRQDRIRLGKCSYYVLYALVNDVSLSRNLLRAKLIVRGSTAAARI